MIPPSTYEVKLSTGPQESIGTKVSWEFKQEPARRLPSAVLLTPVPSPDAECQRDPADGRLDELSWTAVIAPWETDVKAGISWMQAVLNLRFKPGSRALVGSGGAAHYGSLLSSRRRPGRGDSFPQPRTF